MHPSELKNRALVAAARAELDGFTATAEALMLLASACASEARHLEFFPATSVHGKLPRSTYERAGFLEVFH
jgi:hypothetical protein